ncbi:g3940 [Coccomyxa elongata]
MVWAPMPLGPDAPPKLFSEGRALQTAAHLSENIGRRLVSTHQIEQAAQYVAQRARELQELAKNRPDLIVEVDREQTRGAVNMVFAGTHITNAYNNLTNIIVHIAPKAAAHSKAVMINAHFDSVFESPGASDCAACVGTALEVARVIVVSPEVQLATPLMLLLNGGEETILTAAHGFMNTSKWAPRVGAFINLESTGPGGPDVLFQHTGCWALEAYARGAKYPHGSAFGQDLFESRALSMDTDFRMFSSDYFGSLPGIDIAQVLDGAAYHSHHDTVDRIRKGENVLGATIEFSKALKKQETGGLPVWDKGGSVYFDLFGSKMIRYPLQLGRVVHALALPAVMLAALLAARSSKVPITATLGGAALWTAAVASAAAVPAALGKPMIWFGRNMLAHAVYGPAAVAGLLVPFALFPGVAHQPEAAVLGASLVHAAVAAALMRSGMRTSFAFAVWAFAGIASLLVHRKASATQRLAWASATAVPALISVAPSLLTLPLFILEHLSIGGAGKPPLGALAADVVTGLLFGIVAALVLGHLAAWLAYSARPFIWRLVLGLLLVSVAAAAFASRAQHPYSDHFPKRIMLQHLHLLGPDGQLQESRWTVATLDVVLVETALPEGVRYLDNYPGDWQALYPVGNLMRGVALPAPPVDTSLYRPGQMDVSLTGIEAAPSGNASRLLLLMQTPWPAWGLLNVTGPVIGWSFAQENPETEERITRFSGNEGSQSWPFWLDAQGDFQGKVHIELAAINHENTTALLEFASQMPSWTTVATMTTLQASFDF